MHQIIDLFSEELLRTNFNDDNLKLQSIIFENFFLPAFFSYLIHSFNNGPEYTHRSIELELRARGTRRVSVCIIEL
jgi:hypothetical protein